MIFLKKIRNIDLFLNKSQRFFCFLNSEKLKSPSIVYFENGNPSNVLKKHEIETCGKLEYRILEAPINPSDINMIEGTYPIGPNYPPKVAGNEGIGLVNYRGKDYLAIPREPGLGTWRKSMRLSRIDVTLLPQIIEYFEGISMISVNPSTAYRLLNDFAKLQPGDCILQNGANSMVGRCVIQMAKIMGVKTINLVRQRIGIEKTIAELKELGADLVTTNEDIAANLNDISVKINKIGNPRLAFNCVGGKLLFTKFLKKNSTVVTYGAMSKRPIMIGSGSLIFNNIIHKGFWLSDWYKTQSENDKKIMFMKIYHLFKEKKLVLPYKTVDFDDFDQIIDRIENPVKDNKTLIVMRDN